MELQEPQQLRAEVSALAAVDWVLPRDSLLQGFPSANDVLVIAKGNLKRVKFGLVPVLRGAGLRLAPSSCSSVSLEAIADGV